MTDASIPLTVVGGYLGAGKTTIVNHLLRHPGGRRIGVVVNDFGAIGIDADLLAGATVDRDVVNLANGCACCTVSEGLLQSLAALTERPDPVDHVVIEASGVADPTVAAGWATVPPFTPAGVVVVAAADDVRRLARDRYVGGEVRRQLAGADLLLVTKGDLCSTDELVAVDAWLGDESGGAPRVIVERGAVETDVILGIRGVPGAPEHAPPVHAGLYDHRSWTSGDVVPEAQLRADLAALPDGVLRVKGSVRVEGDRGLSVQVVGRRVEIRPLADAPARSALVAIGVRGSLDRLTDPF